MKRLATALVVLMAGIAGVLIYTEAARDREYGRLIEQGDGALAQDQTFLAIEAYSGAIALKSDSMLGYLKRGETYRRRGELVEALRDLKTASDIDPAALRPLERLGDVNYSLNRFARAAERYEAYIRIDDRSPRVLYKLALARYRDSKALLALQPLRQAVALDEKFVEAQYLLGLTLLDGEQPVQARQAFERAVDVAPTFVPAWDELVALARARREPRAALPQLERLAKLEPDRPERQVALGLAYADAGRTDLAVTTLGRAAERFPDEPQVYTALGRVWLNVAPAANRGDRVSLNKAIEALERAATLARASSEALSLYGESLILSGNLPRAEQVLLQAITKPPVDPDTFLRLANAAEPQGHLSVARDALLNYLALAPDTTDVTLYAVRLAELSLQVNDPRTATTWFERALRASNVETPLLLSRLAEAQLRAGDEQAARLTIERGLTLDLNHARLRALARRLKVTAAPASDQSRPSDRPRGN